MAPMKRAIELETTIQKARNAYYNGTAIMSDAQYDAAYDELSKLDPKNPAITSIGAEPVSEWKKYKHATPLGSLNKCNTEEEFLDWANNYCANSQFFTTWKLDGLSVSLVYEEGKLIVAATRGGGRGIGEDLTVNVVKMIGVPTTLPKPINATIRGEIVLSKANHQKYFPDYSNARNAASGISRRYDGTGCEHLEVLVYSLQADDFDIKTLEDQFVVLLDLGFSTPDYTVCNTVKEAYAFKMKFQENIRSTLDFDLDGLVISNNDMDQFESFGHTHNRPKAAIAAKFENESAETVLREVVWQVGHSGRIVPVAIFDEIELAGAKVERATLHNIKRVEELMLYIGCGILVSRRNDVIPFVEDRTY